MSMRAVAEAVSPFACHRLVEALDLAVGAWRPRLRAEMPDPVPPEQLAQLRCVAGDDPAYVAGQLGHKDPTFTLRVYAQAVKHREKLTLKEREAFDRAVEWAQMGTPAQFTVPSTAMSGELENEKPAVSSGFSEWAVLGSNQ